MAFSQADFENPHTKTGDMPAFEESKNVSDDVRGTCFNPTRASLDANRLSQYSDTTR
jgi:hypothetical protein